MRTVISLAAFAALSAMVSLNGQNIDRPYVGRDLPRTATVSYPSEKLSAEQSLEGSRYFQPLDNIKSQENGADHVFTTTFKVPFEWADRQQFLHIGSAGGAYSVSVNGTRVGYNANGRTSAEFDITSASKEGMNTLNITVHTDVQSRILSGGDPKPAVSNAYILSQPRVRIRDFVTKTNIGEETSSLELGVIVKSHLLNPKTVRVYYALTAPDGSAGAYGHRNAEFEMKGEDTVRFFVDLPRAKLWSHETPNIYTLSLKLQHEGRYTEYITYKFGLRTVKMDNGELILNGRAVELHPAPFADNEEDPHARLKELKSEGVNLIMVKGHGQPEKLYEACDRIGLLVCARADITTSAFGTSRKVGGNPSNDPLWKDHYADRALSMYYISRNHPSVAMFSLADDSSNGYNLYESYLSMKEAEANLPVVYLDAGGEWNTDAVKISVSSTDPVAAHSRIVIGNPSAGAIESRPLMDFSVADQAKGVFTVTNNHHSLALNPAEIRWSVRKGKRVLNSGTVNQKLAPGESKDIGISYGKRAKHGDDLTVEFEVYRAAEIFDEKTMSRQPSKKNEPPVVRVVKKSFDIRY